METTTSVQMFARLTPDGTAAAETAVCALHLAASTPSDDTVGDPMYCPDNAALSCVKCGVTERGFTLVVPGFEVVDRSFETASWWDKYQLDAGVYEFNETVRFRRPMWVVEIPATLLESYRVNRLFTASSVKHTTPNNAVKLRFYAQPDRLSVSGGFSIHGVPMQVRSA